MTYTGMVVQHLTFRRFDMKLSYYLKKLFSIKPKIKGIDVKYSDLGCLCITEYRELFSIA